MKLRDNKRLVWGLRGLALLVTVGSIWLFAPWQAALLYFAPLPDTVQELLDDAPAEGLDGVIAYVDKAGLPPAFYAAGWKDRQARIPADPHALFKIASISKLYIAAAAAKMVAAHQLSLEDTLAHMLPHYADSIANADRITLAMMLRHRSGIPNFTDSKQYRWDTSEDRSRGLDLVLNQPADFEPDSAYAYSNTNFLLVGEILDRTLGYSHRDYIKAEILAPLGLSHTFGLYTDVDPADVASGYVVGFEGDTKALNFVTPGGSMVATAEDVGIFLRALNDGSLLNDEEQAVYTSVYPYEHTGLLPGYESFARYNRDIDAVVVLFVSTSGDNAWLAGEAIFSRIMRILEAK
ncbi:MAG: class A beta-lactamase-related serine hydrolase [Alphaproteobacteria bacterium]|nr:MAG: class A beta-lactamase-related serine hydrolase [Alphaproteobacteria bacterium]